jgi:hypothetical protein
LNKKRILDDEKKYTLGLGSTPCSKTILQHNVNITSFVRTMKKATEVVKKGVETAAKNTPELARVTTTPNPSSTFKKELPTNEAKDTQKTSMQPENVPDKHKQNISQGILPKATQTIVQKYAHVPTVHCT